MIPKEIKGTRNTMLLLNKLSSPFSAGVINNGFVNISTRIKEAALLKKFVNVYRATDLTDLSLYKSLMEEKIAMKKCRRYFFIPLTTAALKLSYNI